MTTCARTAGEEENMVRVCAWCMMEMGQVPPLADRRTTHGICELCLMMVEEQIEETADAGNVPASDTNQGVT